MNIGKRKIIVKNLIKVFKVKTLNIPVLKNVNLEIEENNFDIIFGPSGCGKSTLLHILIGLEYPTKGNILFFGQDLYKLPSDEVSEFRKRNIGMIYQLSNWIKSLNVLENVAFPLLLQGVSKDEALLKAEEVLGKVKMDLWSYYQPTELSGGQQQKVALARALITNPPVIIADEPTGNLDYKSGDELMNLLKELNQEGKTILMVSHEMKNLVFAKRIIQIFDGQIIRIHEVKSQKYADIKKALDKSIDLKSVNETNQDIEQRFRKITFEGSIETPISGLIRKIKRLLSIKPRLILKSSFRMFKSVLTLIMFLSYQLGGFISERKLIPRKIGDFAKNKLDKMFSTIMKVFYRQQKNSINYIDIVNISFKNLLAKKTRTLITVVGMAIGIGFIVMLVSLGYGLEKLVLSRVGSLNERKQIEAIPAVSSNVKITDEAIDKFNDIPEISKILPIISIAGKVSYQNSNTDVVVHGVPPDYLEEADLKIDKGETFKASDDNTSSITSPTGTLQAQILGAEGLVKTTEDEVNDSIEIITLPSKSPREAIVNETFIEILGIKDKDPIGQSFDISFIVSNQLLEGEKKKESESVSYTIIGLVVENTTTPVIYTPLEDIKEIGIDYYSQVKFVIGNPTDISAVRSQLEHMGYRTTSIVDTITQIESLFTSARLFLWIIGFIALAVAILGMLNTLTVSLLERTREVGLMKAIGMKSYEVQDLFFAESIAMGILGGAGGLTLGFVIGKLLSIILSVVSVSRGSGMIDVTAIPGLFTILILSLSILVGIATGIYPSKRALEISPLDALRYE
ncbi:MAG: ATP-binding cassette domain-containing protein [Patescibacteria group bacterium]|nr:ATP-binding cassette domain-containing protein [Patescibacteria group bacterium]